MYISCFEYLDSWIVCLLFADFFFHFFFFVHLFIYCYADVFLHFAIYLILFLNACIKIIAKTKSVPRFYYKIALCHLKYLKNSKNRSKQFNSDLLFVCLLICINNDLFPILLEMKRFQFWFLFFVIDPKITINCVCQLIKWLITTLASSSLNLLPPYMHINYKTEWTYNCIVIFDTLFTHKPKKRKPKSQKLTCTRFD